MEILKISWVNRDNPRKPKRVSVRFKIGQKIYRSYFEIKGGLPYRVSGRENFFIFSAVNNFIFAEKIKTEKKKKISMLADPAALNNYIQAVQAGACEDYLNLFERWEIPLFFIKARHSFWRENNRLFRLRFCF